VPPACRSGEPTAGTALDRKYDYAFFSPLGVSRLSGRALELGGSDHKLYRGIRALRVLSAGRVWAPSRCVMQRSSARLSTHEKYCHNGVHGLRPRARQWLARGPRRRSWPLPEQAVLSVRRGLAQGPAAAASAAAGPRHALGRGIRAKRTRPYLPQTNGKGGALPAHASWRMAYARPYRHESER
jgi:hypothetical protein